MEYPINNYNILESDMPNATGLMYPEYYFKVNYETAEQKCKNIGFKMVTIDSDHKWADVGWNV